MVISKWLLVVVCIVSAIGGGVIATTVVPSNSTDDCPAFMAPSVTSPTDDPFYKKPRRGGSKEY